MARLPQPGDDGGLWGDVLNEYLLVSHNDDGTIRDGVVTETNLSSSVQAKINTVTTDRSTHTGTQAMSTVTGLEAALEGKITGSGITRIVAITQSAYAALATKSASTLYVIVAEQNGN
jgi:hypothetical protein